MEEIAAHVVEDHRPTTSVSVAIGRAIGKFILFYSLKYAQHSIGSLLAGAGSQKTNVV